MSSNVFEHPFLSGLLGDPDMAKLFSAQEDIASMLKFEVALADTQGKLGIISEDAAEKINNGIQSFIPDMDKLNTVTAKDGVVVPELVRQLREHVGGTAAESIHHGATSQDVVDTSLVLRLNLGTDLLSASLNTIIQNLDILNSRFGSNAIMARTRMQNAKPSAVAKQLANWLTPLEKLKAQLINISSEVGVLQLGGAIGGGENFGEHYQQLVSEMARSLDLSAPTQSWHTDRTSFVNLANWLSMTTGSLGKIGQDVVLMSMNEIDEIKLSDAGGSSAMPHKQNPVKAEILATFASFNATQLSAMQHTLVHENNRSGAKWTLEWMVLPQMMMATAASLRTANLLLDSVQEFGKEV